jgi:UDP-N-acetylenolpyruvoylglucosamine reductase
MALAVQLTGILPRRTQENSATRWPGPKPNRLLYLFLGMAQNLLISDAGFRGLVIHMKKCCQELSVLAQTVFAPAVVVHYSIW